MKPCKHNFLLRDFPEESKRQQQNSSNNRKQYHLRINNCLLSGPDCNNNKRVKEENA